jgi:hypothetical protein
MEVTCNNKGKISNDSGCPWKSTLNNLLNHLRYCYYVNYKLPEYIKKRVDSVSKIETNEDGEVASDKYLDFNPRSSLAARLYIKNPELMTNAMKENQTDDLDIIEILTSSDKKTISTMETSLVENINNITNINTTNLKRSNS